MEDFNLEGLTIKELKRLKSKLIEEIVLLNSEILTETDVLNKSAKSKLSLKKSEIVRKIEDLELENILKAGA